MKQTRCPSCKKTIQVGSWAWCPHEPVHSQHIQQLPPFVIYRNQKGEVQFPANADTPLPKRLVKLGFQRIEIPYHEGHTLEREMNTREKLRYEQAKQREYEVFGSRRKELNAELRQRAQHFSAEGRALVQECMRRYDQKSSCPSFDPGFHIDVLHNYTQSRDAYCDERTGWKSRKD